MIGNVDVEAGIGARGVAVQRLWHGDVGEEARPGWFQASALGDAGQFKALAEIQEGDPVTLEVAPDAARFGQILRLHRRGPPGKGQAAGSRGNRAEILAIAGDG